MDFLSLIVVDVCSTTDACHFQWCRAVQSNQYCPYSCRWLCLLYDPFVPYEFFRFQLLADASPLLADFGTRFSLVFRSNGAMKRIQPVRQCLDIVFHGTSFPVTVTVAVFRNERKKNRKTIDIRLSEFHQILYWDGFFYIKPKIRNHKNGHHQNGKLQLITD